MQSSAFAPQPIFRAQPVVFASPVADEWRNPKYFCCGCLPVRMCSIIIAAVYLFAAGEGVKWTIITAMFGDALLTASSAFGCMSNFVCAVVLIIGIFRENTRYLWTFILIAGASGAIISIILLITGYIFLSSETTALKSWYHFLGCWAIIRAILQGFLTIWFILVVHRLIIFFVDKEQLIPPQVPYLQPMIIKPAPAFDEQ